MDTTIFTIAQTEHALRHSRKQQREGYTVRAPNALDKLAAAFLAVVHRPRKRLHSRVRRVAPAR